MVALATLGSYGLYYVCLSRFSPTKVSTVLYLSPPVAMLWARAMFGEPLSLGMGIGLVVTLGGVFIANRGGQH
ncbi:EamA family transporter [Novosphingobium sp.]|uniref:EamA family transporter n=1 Tax=Novosphingobium sp. TaxID=1874826 RepID=UPI0031D1CE84